MKRVASSDWVGLQVRLALDQWTRAARPWAGSGPVYSAREHKQREKAYDHAVDEVRRSCRKQVPDPRVAEERLTQSFARFAAEALDLGPDAIQLLTSGFLPVGKQLARWAHRFDPALSHAAVTQAARNAWTACGMQPLFGAPLRLTPSILGYSLLYPYTDNFLDQRIVSSADKVRFSRRFRERLRGQPLIAEPHESRLWEMVRLIEEEFPRPGHGEVFDALLAIHAAQEESVRQLHEAGRLTETELLHITCAKGGTSVLADACLVRGTLNSQQSEFAFLWGVLLQLGDDLQDIREDLELGSDTLFTRAVRAGQPIDALAEQLLNFANVVGARMDALGDAESPSLNHHKDLLRMSWRSLILMTIGDAHTRFSPQFLARMEPYSPFRFAFLRRRREKLAGDHGVFERIFELVLNRDEPHDNRLPLPQERRTAAQIRQPLNFPVAADQTSFSSM